MHSTFTPGTIKHICNFSKAWDDDNEMDVDCTVSLEDDNTDAPDSDNMFSCPDQSCIMMYTRRHLLDIHVFIGKHVYSTSENSYDSDKRVWAEKCAAVDNAYKVISFSTRCRRERRLGS